MKKLLLSLALINLGIAYAETTNTSASAVVAKEKPAIADGLYKSTTSETFVKIANTNDNGLTIPVVSHRTVKIESDSTIHGVSFDERVFFKKVSPTTYVSTHEGTKCIATISKVAPDAFTIKVNSIDECFNKHSQFNATAPTSDQTKSVQPFMSSVFKLDTNPAEIKYFSAF